MKKYNIAVVGATGNVGRELLDTLAERDFPIDNLYAVASSRSEGQELTFADDKTIMCEDLAKFDFTKVDIALFSAGGSVSAQYAPKAAEQGCIVIDNSSHFRMHEDVPLVVPEVNLHALADYKQKNIIANPNCSTMQMVVALKPIHDNFGGINTIKVATYQSVSGAGKAAMDELFQQTADVYANKPLTKSKFAKEVAFNAIPHIDIFMDDGATKEEWKMRVETKKILSADIDVSAMCVRIPTFIGHGEAVWVECNNNITADAVRTQLENANGVVVVDHHNEQGFITPKEAAGQDPVYVSRIRQDNDNPRSILMWVVADNIRKGAALNAIQIAETLINDGYI
jgi:aspartate-semialdehyde dehydrogenase